MAEAAKRSSGNTDLYIGTLKAEVGLFGTNAKPAGLPGFVNAGPNGGELRYEMRGAAAPAEAPAPEEGQSDPLATSEGDPGREAPVLGDEEAAPATAMPDGGGATVPGEFRRVLVEANSNEVVEPEDVRRGVRLDDGRFIDCTDQLAAIEGQTKLDRMDVVKFIDSTRIRRQRVLGAYYVGGQDAKAKAVLKLMWAGLRERREVAVVKYTTRSRQQLGVVEAAADGHLVLLALVWSEDWREAPAKAQLASIEVPAAQVEKMKALMAALHGHVDVLDELRDDAIALREELHARALAGEMAEVIEPLPAAEEDADLGDVLEASLAAVKAGKV
jgi:non-homologous end joining protein Ku